MEIDITVGCLKIIEYIKPLKSCPIMLIPNTIYRLFLWGFKSAGSFVDGLMHFRLPVLGTATALIS
jgi:hypothetical protein